MKTESQKALAVSRQQRHRSGGTQINAVLRDPEAIAALVRLKNEHGSLVAALTHALKTADPCKPALHIADVM